MNKYHIRFNTKHNGSELVWRIFENGEEHLASSVKIFGETFTECTEEFGETKWNIACYGDLKWMPNKEAFILTGKYNHAHPDSDLFNERTREITLADYIKKVTQYPCVVVGANEEKDDVAGQRTEKSQD